MNAPSDRPPLGAAPIPPSTYEPEGDVVTTAQVVLSGERHYFGFRVAERLPEGTVPTRCSASPRCTFPGIHRLDYAYVRQRDMHPTYVVEMACVDHARRFAKDWGLADPTGGAS